MVMNISCEFEKASYNFFFKVDITRLAIGIDTQVTHHVVAMEKVAE